MVKQTTYADSGVNIDLGDDVSKILYNAAKQTWDNRKGKLGEVITPFDDFTGIRAIDVSNLPSGTLMNLGFDGIGTKVKVAQMLDNHRTMAYDLIAMVCDDAVVRGAEPVLVGSILDVNSLVDKNKKPLLEKVNQLAEGYIKAGKEANVAIINGETAELGDCVGGFGPFNYNWGAGVVWFAKKDRLFTGREINPGDYLVGLKEEGFRSNGLSLVRKVMENTYGEDWHKIPWKEGALTLADMVLIPSKIYTRAVVDMFGGFDREPKTEIHGVAHITGGGIPGKLGRVLKPSGLGAVIDNPFDPSEFMEYTQALGNVPDIEAYRTWNMRHGMIIITPKPEEVMKIASDYNIESQTIGMITKEPGIDILNRGAFAPDKCSEKNNLYKQGEKVLSF
ncbi:MAG: phosphoribosylformylglycinamidine cyclo-ligase [Nanobdellota archaeon]